jgi:hypothetical protein
MFGPLQQIEELKVGLAVPTRLAFLHIDALNTQVKETDYLQNLQTGVAT